MFIEVFLNSLRDVEIVFINFLEENFFLIILIQIFTYFLSVKRYFNAAIVSIS
jgi:hypothetical protein